MKTDVQARIDAQFELGPGRQSAPFAAAAFDGFYPTNPNAKVAERRPSREVQTMSIREALEWAFGTELASLDYDEWAKAGVGIEFVMMQRAMVGTVDTSIGRSHPASDAELIADAVRLALPWRVAMWIAELARSGLAPDPLIDATPKLEPAEWGHNRHGRFAKRVDLANPSVRGAYGITLAGTWPVEYRTSKRRGEVREPIWFVPCVWSTSAREIAAARRKYQLWRSALFDVRTAVKRLHMPWLHITDELPALAPWNEGG